MSRERAVHLAEEITASLQARPDLFRVDGDASRLARGLAQALMDLVQIEDEITQEAMAAVASYARSVAPGSSEWELLVAKHKEEIAARRGYILG